MQRLDYVGYWWIGEEDSFDVNNKVFGTLKYDQESYITLSLCGDFYGFKDFTSHNKIEVIKGFTSNGKKITLLNSNVSDRKMNFPGMITSEYNPQLVIVGNWYKSEKEILLSEICANYNFLDEWANINSFSLEQDDKENTINVCYSLKDITSYDSGEYKMSIEYELNTNFSNVRTLLNEKAYVKFRKYELFTFEEGQSQINIFANFLTLCTTEYCYPTEIRAKDGLEVEISIIYRQSESKVKKESKHFAITYLEIIDNFQQYWSEWINKRMLLEPIIYSFVEAHQGVFHIPASYLKLTQALETFSRRMRNNSIIQHQEHEERVKRILSKIEVDEDREWLSEILEFSNEPNLRVRLNKLFQEVNFIFELNANNRNTLVHRATKTRNYYTHFNESIKNEILDYSGTFYMGQCMQQMLRVLFMKELGFSEEFIKSNIDSNKIKIIKQGLAIN